MVELRHLRSSGRVIRRLIIRVIRVTRPPRSRSTGVPLQLSESSQIVLLPPIPRSRLLGLALLIGSLTTLGCSSSPGRMDSARLAFYQGDWETAASELDKIGNSRRFNTSAQLNRAIVDLAKGDPAAAESRLRILRDKLDNTPPLASLATAASMATDDLARPFQIAPEETVLIRSLLALASMVNDNVDAESYTLQASTLRQKLIADSTPDDSRIPADRDVALVPYVRGVVREATHHDYDDASRSYAQVAALVPTFAAASDDVVRAGGGVHSESGNGVLYVIALVGPGPVLVETTAQTTSDALAIASAVMSAQVHDGGGPSAASLALPNIASVKIPAVQIPPSQIRCVAVQIESASVGVTQTVTDLARIAIRREESQRTATIARALIRRATKEAAVAATAKASGLQGNGAQLFQFAAGSAWAASERADTRCWSLLPREFQVFRMELPAGVHQVHLSPLNDHGLPLSPGQTTSVQIEDGRNAYRLVIAPGSKISVVGQ